MMINLAMKTAEEQMRAGKASSQVITHFLRLGTERARLERERIQAEVELARAKVDNLDRQQGGEELFQKALDAFSSYRTHTDEEYYDGYEAY